MKTQSVGLIETKGLIAAMVGADAMTKSANVEIVGNKYYKVKSGIVTIIVTGDVGAVKAAVEIGEQEARKVGTLITSHVIARPDEFVMKMILPKVYEEVKEDIKKKDKKETKEETKEVKEESKEDNTESKKEDIEQEEIVIKPIESKKEDKKEKNKSKELSKEDKKHNKK